MPRPFPFTTSALLSLLTLPSVFAGVGFDCSKVVADGVTWDLSTLGGPTNLFYTHEAGSVTHNTTFTLDICKPIKRTKGVPASEECPTGSRICAIETILSPDGNGTTIEAVIPIAGDFGASHGKALESTPTRLKGAESHEDSEREGLRVAFSGGEYDSKDQKAIIEFICDKERTGLEGEDGKDHSGDKKKGDDDDEKEKEKEKEKRADKEEDGDKKKSDTKASLRFISYKDEAVKNDVWGVLRLEWKTKYACEKVERSPEDVPSKSGWGFFSWFIIILFVGIAAYLIFGSWMNYSRYGARGWDLLPHGDTIRDIPYLMKDFGRRVVGTVQGGGSRGGYSAL